MSQLRKVSFATKFRLVKQKPIQFRLLIAFILIPILHITATYISLYRYMNDDVPVVNYNKVNEQGKLTQGTIEKMEFSEVPFGTDQPTVISYTYMADKGEVSSKFQTLKPENIVIGKQVDVKFYDEESIILGLEPYNFPFYIFFVPAFPFFIISILLTIYFLFTISRQIKLLTHGEIRDAEIVSLFPKSGFPFTLFGGKVHVIYRYQISGNNKVEGEADTRDLSIMKEKKRGDTIKIFVSPDNEFVTCLVSTVDAQTNNWKID